MNAKILITGVALAALAAGGATAHVHKHMRGGSTSGAYAAPAQPIPYAQLDAYLSASPREREQMAMGGGAATGSPTDTAAAAPSSDTAGPAPANDMASPPAPSAGDTNPPPAGDVNPPSNPAPSPSAAASPSQPGASPAPEDQPTPPK